MAPPKTRNVYVCVRCQHILKIHWPRWLWIYGHKCTSTNVVFWLRTCQDVSRGRSFVNLWPVGAVQAEHWQSCIRTREDPFFAFSKFLKKFLPQHFCPKAHVRTWFFHTPNEMYSHHQQKHSSPKDVSNSAGKLCVQARRDFWIPGTSCGPSSAWSSPNKVLQNTCQSSDDRIPTFQSQTKQTPAMRQFFNVAAGQANDMEHTCTQLHCGISSKAVKLLILVSTQELINWICWTVVLTYTVP